jgi:serine/threonine-protein kinase RsbW
MEEVAQIKIRSSLDNICKVENLIQKICSTLTINEVKYNNMLLANVEAVTNAIEHGNNLDEKKQVTFRAFRCEHSVKFSIQDQGNGFFPDQLPDPTSAKLKEQPDGRGVFLMKQLADEIDFYEGGTRVDMRFFLS